MSLRIVRYLQITFWILGWAILAITAAGMVLEAYYYFFQPSDFLSIRPDFFFPKQVRLLLSSVGKAFFAFLVSTIFGMILHKPVHEPQTKVFLGIACAGFIAEGAIGLIGWVQWGIHLAKTSSGSFSIDSLTALSHGIELFQHLIPFVYALTLYVLHQHFSRLVTFETEVI